ncbi:Repeat domain-containing protein [Neorhodopirellula lusitana]|uniref:Repeat domain-containing protein n=1 Tax=Neorhodopirellula lusitana TaxID=445327 RepID=A0ABY1QS30_9BACT|nr:FG-GAP-like repeat-containing protein [Neorhodopirellula lusitana]SMP77339.1 Repeat domain-containing protein [Neorhodopirellula lusitana]
MFDQRKTRRRLFFRLITLFVLSGLWVIAACNRTQDQPLGDVADASVSGDPLLQMRTAVSRRQWQEAWRLSNAALTQHPDDANAIQLVASVAQKIGEFDVAANLMVDACRAESLQNPSRLQLTADALLKVGRVFDCMDLLEDSLEVDPMRHQVRQFFYNLCWETENRVRAIPHGRFLVRHRHFDLRLLLSLSYSESGTDRLDSFIEMVDLHPQDNRPLVAEAKFLFDQGKFEQAAIVVRKVLDSRSDHPPAIVLLARVLVASESDDEFVALMNNAPESVKDYPGYWLAVGDWCWSHQLDHPAARAYWEATRRDADNKEAWGKLVNSLTQVDKSEARLDQATIEAMQNRVTLLTRLSNAMNRVRYVPSRANAIETAEVLESLGRLWEAEAWASVAMQFPPDESVDVKRVRESIIAMMSKQTPWQMVRKHPELKADLGWLPLPELASDQMVIARQSKAANLGTRKPGRIALTNEATERSLDYFGRTGEDLERPGISFHQTLGCGGGTIDFDLDGWSDLYLAAAGGTPPQRDSQSNKLWRNQDGFFVDVTHLSESGDAGFGQGVAVGDINEDGFPDLLVLNYGPNTLLVNNGDGTFANASERFNQEGRGMDWSSSGAIADLDQDGLADAIVLSYGNDLAPVRKICRDGRLVKACGPLNFKASPDRCLHNSETGNLIDSTEAWGIPSDLGRGLGVVIGSFDQEPGVDVFIANDQSVNHYWNRSERTGLTFQESAILKGLASNHGSPYQGSMGIANGDFDRDGDIDFYVTNFDKECNTYHEQESSGVWRDQTVAQKLYTPTLPSVGFGAQAVDLDNDGFLEIVVSNGHVDAPYPGDDSAPHAQRMQIFQRKSDGGFKSIGESIGGEYLNSNHVGRALWTLDVNRDGLTDFAVTHQTERAAVLVNRTKKSGNWIGFQLSGRHCSRDAIGAILEVHSGNQRWVTALTSGDGYLCSNERVLRIGLGELSGACDVTTNWPNGQRQTHAQLRTNTQWLLVEGDGDAFELSGVPNAERALHQ